MVVAAGEGAGPSVSGVLPAAVRHDAHLMFTGPALVTGAAGFAGSHLLDALCARSVAVQGWARPDTPAVFGHVPPAVSWRHVELLDAPAVREALADLRPSVIFHLAGAAHVGQSWQAVA